jgi:RNA polymerase sigma-70 factor (ECF subfamily)
VKAEFEALYQSHYPRVLGLCNRLLGRGMQAEDAAQEVFVRAYRRLDQYDTTLPFGAWVGGIATHHCVDLLRRRARERRLFDDAQPEAIADDALNGAALLTQTERTVRVQAAIAELPDKYRVPLVLAYYFESSYDEIAQALGVTSNHVGVLLLRGKRMLRGALAEFGEEP